MCNIFASWMVGLEGLQGLMHIHEMRLSACSATSGLAKDQQSIAFKVAGKDNNRLLSVTSPEFRTNMESL